LQQPGVFVRTPAIIAAADPQSPKCFFVGRRGTGKTAITYYLKASQRAAVQIHPQAFVPSSIEIEPEVLRDTRQRAFKSLVSCYKRAIILEVVARWVGDHHTTYERLSSRLKKERNACEQMDFDIRLLSGMEDVFGALAANTEREWLKHINGTKEIVQEVDTSREGVRYTLLIDKLDEAWDGSEKAVAFLTGLMHACVELSATCKNIRPLLFLRENMYERVRQLDQEFSRLESSVVSLDWTQELLLELVERRMNSPFSSKLPLGGETWDHFFEL